MENGSRHLATVSTVQFAEYGTRGFLRHCGLALSCLVFFFAAPDQLAFFRPWPAPCVTEVSERVRERKKRTDFKCTMQLMMQVAQRATFIIAKLHPGRSSTLLRYG